MKYVKLTNRSRARMAYSGLRDGSGRALVIDPGATKPVHPSIINDPRIQRDLAANVLGMSQPADAPAAPMPPKAAVVPPPKAPEPPAAPPPVAPPPVEPPAATPEPEPEPEEEPVSPEGPDLEALRELFLEAPGITEKNVDSILKAFPSIEALADASDDELTAAGVNRSFTGRVLEWAIERT